MAPKTLSSRFLEYDQDVTRISFFHPTSTWGVNILKKKSQRGTRLNHSDLVTSVKLMLIQLCLLKPYLCEVSIIESQGFPEKMTTATITLCNTVSNK